MTSNSIKSKTLSNSNSMNDSEIPISQESGISQMMFKGLVFILNGFDSDEYASIISSIHALGGKIVSPSYSGIPDFGVVPTFGAELRHTVKEVVTDLFIVIIFFHY